MIVLKYFIICLFFVFTHGAMNSWDAQDKMGERDRLHLFWLAKELVRDAKLYMRQLREVVDEYAPLLPFEIGLIMGKVREKLKLMMEIYRQIRDRHSKTNKIFGPGIRILRPMHYILIMEEIHRLEVDIDKYVSVIENIPDDRWDDEPLFAKPLPDKKQKPKNKLLRQGAGVTESVSKSTQLSTDNPSAAIQERQFKSKMREQFLMKRLGMPANHTTTKKRFINSWPVADTWSLEQYSLA